MEKQVGPQHSLFMLVSKEGEELLRISEDGEFFVRGRLIGEDKEVLEAFRQFLGVASYSKMEER